MWRKVKPEGRCVAQLTELLSTRIANRDISYEGKDDSGEH
jgi:hypothetical protein